MNFKSKIKIFLKSDFNRNILTLMTGTTIAQAIPIAISPILTRIYTPDDFGLLALFISVTSVLSVIATMRYELAIVQPSDEEDAFSLVVLSSVIAFFMSVLVFLLIYIFKEEIVATLGNQEIEAWLYFIPFTMFLAGLYQTLTFWNVRKECYTAVAKSKVAQGFTTATVQVGFKFLTSSGSLILGYILGVFASCMFLLKRMVKATPTKNGFIKKENIFKNAKRYRKLPIYSTFGALSDSTSLQMPVFIISKFFDMSVTGMYSLTFKVLTLPVAIMSQALTQVLFQKVARLYNTDPEKVQFLILKIFIVLLSLMVPFVAFIWVFGVDLFAFVFGEPWREAGEMASILVFASAIRFSVGPLSGILALEHNIKLGVTWQVIYLVTISTTLYYFSSWPINNFLIAFVLHEIILYILYFHFILKGAKNFKQE